MKAKGCGGVPMDKAAPRTKVLSFRVTLRMGICSGISAREAHELWEVEVDENVSEEDDAVDGVARHNFRTTSKTHRIPEFCRNIACSVQQTQQSTEYIQRRGMGR